MKKNSLLAFDMLRKEEIASLNGGGGKPGSQCACICIGVIKPAEPFGNGEVQSSDADCTDCGALNVMCVISQ